MMTDEVECLQTQQTVLHKTGISIHDKATKVEPILLEYKLLFDSRPDNQNFLELFKNLNSIM